MSNDAMQQVSLFVKESIVVSAANADDFNHVIAKFMENGWMTFGQMFAVGDKFAVNMVKLDPRLTGMVNKTIDLLLQQLGEM